MRDDAPVESVRLAAARSLDAVQKHPLADAQLLGHTVTAADVVSTLNGLIDASKGGDWPRQVCDRLRLYRVDLQERLLFTGYYQPKLFASRTRTKRFRYPLYRTPDDLVDVDLGQSCPTCKGQVGTGRMQDGTLVPYYSRAEIEAGALAGRGYELAWLDDPVDAFLVHVQGSAALVYGDGVHTQIGYGGSNGRPYTSIGGLLVEQGKMSRDDVSLRTLKDYLHTHPDEQASLLGADEHYVFFRTVAAGPIGSLGAPLTAGRSVAADPTVYPPGGVVFMHVAQPDGRQPFVTRFALIQDRGVAVDGLNHIDLFWGTGTTAEAIAGGMRNPGELYVVLPR
ncbi:MAG: murein transglycosylase A [Candidatus Binatia bacterium]